MSVDLDRELTSIDLLKYAKKIAPKWKEIGLVLGLKPEDIGIIEVDHRISCEEACQAMLFKWRKKNPRITVGMLRKAIKSYKVNEGSYKICTCMQCVRILLCMYLKFWKSM